MKTTEQKQLEKINQLNEQKEALEYAIQLVEKKHAEALDIVQNVPTNIYIEDWKREEKKTRRQVASLIVLKSNLIEELTTLWNEWEKTHEQTRKEIDTIYMDDLTSAYQEQAIDEAIEYAQDNEMENAQEFVDACCDYYREQLKKAGFEGQKIYKGFADYGDECQVQSVALEVWAILTK